MDLFAKLKKTNIYFKLWKMKFFNKLTKLKRVWDYLKEN